MTKRPGWTNADPANAEGGEKNMPRHPPSEDDQVQCSDPSPALFTHRENFYLSLWRPILLLTEVPGLLHSAPASLGRCSVSATLPPR